MKRISGAVLAVVVLAAAGFALASIASGANLVAALTGTTDTTTTSTTDTTTTSTTETPGGSGRRVTVCHHRRSKKHPYVTITVSWHAVHAVVKHGGYVGPCTKAGTALTTKKEHGKHGERRHRSGNDSSEQSGQTAQQSGQTQQQNGPTQPQSQPTPAPNGHGSENGQGSQHRQDNRQGKQNGGSGHHKGP